MRVATILNVHADTKCVVDTVDAITKYAGDKVLVVADGATWDDWGSKLRVDAYKLQGFIHGYGRAPYRNVALGLKEAANLWINDVDWFCYTEYDTLFGSSDFKAYLQAAKEQGIWCLGNDYRESNIKFPLLELMLKQSLGRTAYLLGCCVFYSAEFIKKLLELDFFERFLYLTNDFSQGFFPQYESQGGYDLSEHLYPTLAVNLGGKVGQLAVFNEKDFTWGGYYETFLCRFRPDLDVNVDLSYKNASIMHPVKNYDNPIRVYHRKNRERIVSWKKI